MLCAARSAAARAAWSCPAGYAGLMCTLLGEGCTFCALLAGTYKDLKLVREFLCHFFWERTAGMVQMAIEKSAVLVAPQQVVGYPLPAKTCTVGKLC